MIYDYLDVQLHPHFQSNRSWSILPLFFFLDLTSCILSSTYTQNLAHYQIRSSLLTIKLNLENRINTTGSNKGLYFRVGSLSINGGNLDTQIRKYLNTDNTIFTGIHDTYKFQTTDRLFPLVLNVELDLIPENCYNSSLYFILNSYQIFQVPRAALFSLLHRRIPLCYTQNYLLYSSMINLWNLIKYCCLLRDRHLDSILNPENWSNTGCALSTIQDQW